MKRTTVSKEIKMHISEIQLRSVDKIIENSGDEKRRATRIEINRPVRYRMLANGTNQKWEDGTAFDLSQRGLRLMAQAELSVGTEIEMYLKLSEDSKTLRVEGEVVWSDRSNNGSRANGSTTAQHGLSFKEAPYPGKEKMVQFIADQLCSFACRGKLPFSTRTAETFEELKAAYAMVYEGFLPRGYCMENPSGMFYSFYCALPDSRTFLLEKKGKLIGTLSLIVDSLCGLPIESIYPEEITKLRSEGRRVAEISLLSLSQNEFFKNGVFSLTHLKKLIASFQLFKIMFDYARSQAKATDLIIGVHPKHLDLYRYLKFEEIGPVRSYQSACGNPAVLMRMDIRHVEKTVPTDRGVGSYFLTDMLSGEILRKRYEWNTETARKLLIEAQPIWAKIPPRAQDYLKTCYPGLV